MIPANSRRMRARPRLMKGFQGRPFARSSPTTDLFHDCEADPMSHPELIAFGTSLIASPHYHLPPDLSQAMLANALDSEQILHSPIGSTFDDSPGEGWTDPRQRFQFGR